MKNIPTPHISAQFGQIAKKVIMPGDPKRAQWIAQNFLTNPVLVSDVRCICAYTGKYNGEDVTVMAHGMGMGSISIYVYELFNFYGVEEIYRVGSCGAMVPQLHLGDVFLVDTAWADSNIPKWMGLDLANQKEIPANHESYHHIVQTAQKLAIPLTTGKTISSDLFYHQYSYQDVVQMTNGAKVTEMESFALFAHALQAKKKAACLLTISDSLVTHEAMSSEQRQTTFKNMVKLALEAITSK